MDDRAGKQQHSPWSAPRDRRKRNKHNPAQLTISEDLEYTSPPKRRNGRCQLRCLCININYYVLFRAIHSLLAAPAQLTASPADGPAAPETSLVGGADPRGIDGPLRAGPLFDMPVTSPVNRRFSPLQAGLVNASFTSTESLRQSMSAQPSPNSPHPSEPLAEDARMTCSYAHQSPGHTSWGNDGRSDRSSSQPSTGFLPSLRAGTSDAAKRTQVSQQVCATALRHSSGRLE